MSTLGETMTDCIMEMDTELREHVKKYGIEVKPDHVDQLVKMVKARQKNFLDAFGIGQNALRRVAYSFLEGRIEDIKLAQDGEIPDHWRKNG